MFGLGRRHSDTLYGVLIDVGSGSIGVSIVVSDHSKELPETLFSHRIHIKVGKESASFSERIRAMREALFSACLILSRDGIAALKKYDSYGRIHKISITCSSPWSYTVARTVHYENDTELRITRALIDDLVKSAESEITSHIHGTTLPHDLEFQVVERATVDVRVNDYLIEHPIGLKGTSISLSHISGIVPNEIIRAVYEVEEKIFPNTGVRAHTLMLVLYCVIRDVFPTEHNYAIINIEDESIEFGIIESSTLIQSVYVPFGSNMLIRGLMGATNSTSTDVLSILRAYEEKRLANEDADLVKRHITLFFDTLKKRMMEGFEQMRVPKTFVVISEIGLDALFGEGMRSVITTFAHTESRVLAFNHELGNAVAEGEDHDMYLKMSARFFHKLHGCGEIDVH